MLIIGGYINTSISGISEIIIARDNARLLNLARLQLDGGANILAVNCGTHMYSEVDDLVWCVNTLHTELDVPLCIDTPNPEAMAAGLAACRHGRPIVDSTTLEAKRIKAILPLVKQYDAQLTVLMHDERGMPLTMEDRLNLMPKVEQMTADYGLKRSDIFLDCLLFPCSVDTRHSRFYIESVSAIRSAYPGYQFSCGTDNVSFGMPCRNLITATFLGMLAGIQQEAAMLKLTPALIAALRAVQLLSDQDEMGMDFIEAYHDDKLNVFPETEASF